MPRVRPHESEKDYVARCIPVVLHEGTATDGPQAAAMCHSMWRQAKKRKRKAIVDAILKSIKTVLDGESSGGQEAVPPASPKRKRKKKKKRKQKPSEAES